MIPRNLAVAALMLRPTVKLLPWRHFLGGAAIAATLLGAAQVADVNSDVVRVAILRIVIVVLATSCAFALDERSTDLSEAAPVPSWVRRGLRILIISFVLTSLWAAAMALAGADLRTSRAEELVVEKVAELPIGHLTWEYAGLALLTLSAAAVSSRRDGSAGFTAAAITLGLAGAAAIAPPPWRLFAPYVEGGSAAVFADARWAEWSAEPLKWAVLAGVAIMVIGWALRDSFTSRVVAPLRRGPLGGYRGLRRSGMGQTVPPRGRSW